MPAHLSQYLIMLPIMAWVVWRRVSRSFGRQPIKRKAMIARIAIFAVIGMLLALAGLQKIELAEGLFGGAILGAGLGILGVRLTRFEVDPLRGDCYVPNPWIGAFLTALLLGRLAYRFVSAYLPQMQQTHAAMQAQGATDAGAQAWSSSYTSSPLTMLVIGLLIGYYILYFTGLLIHHRRFQRAQLGATAV
jgi:MFS family permease